MNLSEMLNIKLNVIVWLLLPAYTTFSLAGELQPKNTKNSSNNAITSFATPSGNIYCALVGEEKNVLRCEIRSRLKPLPPQPYPGYCQFDWGAGFSLSQHGRSKVLCISDTIASRNSYTLAYGSTWRHSGFQCISKRTGLICKNSYGNGFSLNRNKWSTFSKRE